MSYQAMTSNRPVLEKRAMDSPRIGYVPHSGTTPEGETSALAAVYRLILDCHARKENAAGVTSTNGDDAKGSRNDRAKKSIPRQST